MNTTDLSLLISFIAVAVAALALGWNIYRDVILKAKVKVSVGIVDLHHPEFPGVPKFILISATNLGPGKVRIMNIALMDAPWNKRILQTQRHAILNPDWTNPLSGRIPSWIDQGDKLDLLLDFKKDSFLGRDFSHVGVFDYYGRSHWAPKTDLIEAKRIWKENFQENPPD